MRAVDMRSRRVLTITILLLTAIASLAVSVVSASAGCDFDLQGSGRVKAVIGPRTLLMMDGREIRLAALEIPASAADNATRILSQTALDREVTLHGTTDMPDRYGRQPAFAIVYGTDKSLQEILLADGAAAVNGGPGRPCTDALHTAEQQARNRKAGIWGDPDFIKNATEPDKILSKVGHFTVVEGRVVSVRPSGGTIYLNFATGWRQGFAASFSKRMIATFAAAGLTPAALDKKRIRVRGWIEKRGGPRIEVTRPDQIELIGDDSAIVAGGN